MKFSSCLCCLPCGLLLLGLVACSTDRPNFQNVSVKETPNAPTAMMAHGAFFAGTVRAEVLLGAGVGFGPESGKRKGFWSYSGSKDNDRDIAPASPYGMYDDNYSDEEYYADPVYYPTQGSTLPPVQLRMRLTNTGSVPVDVEILDFNSSLGNFSVQPPRLTLTGGEAREVEPMTSRMGVTADEVPLTVRLRANGLAEQQVLKLQLVKKAPRSTEPQNPPAPPTRTP
ncbi:MAG: hypothetical protein PHQ04_11120 [Opitutaceae bacterium]|nr:hypothetical protein [Opitutaceae bacterium]